MRRSISLLLLVCMLFIVLSVSASVAAEDLKTPSDIAKVLIYTENNASIPSTKEKVNCDIYIVDKDGGEYGTVYGTGCTVNVRGNSTSSAYKKPYNIKFPSKTDVLGMGANKKWSLLANCYDKTLLRNAVVMDFARELGVPYTPDYRYVDVYVNDELCGSYVLIDSVEVSSTRVDIDLSNNEYLLELDYNPEDADCYYFYSGINDIKFAVNEPEIADLSDTQMTYVNDLVYNAESALDSGDFDEVSAYFDIESMARFYLTLEFFRNIDVATSSTRFHIKGDKIYGGPVWDFDLSSGNYNADYYGSSTLEQRFHATKMKWFKLLVQYPEFQSRVNELFLEMQDTIVNLYTDNILGLNKIDTMINTYSASFSRNHNEAGWAPNRVYHSSMQLERTPDATYEENVEFYRNWLLERNEWLLDQWGLESFIELEDNASISEQDFVIYGVTEKTPVSSLVSQFYTEGVELMSGESKLYGDTYVPNGAIATVGGASYVVLVCGDVNCDGVVDQQDYLLIKRICTQTIEVDDIRMSAANVNNDDMIDSSDYILVKRYCFGTYDIYNTGA